MTRNFSLMMSVSLVVVMIVNVVVFVVVAEQTKRFHRSFSRSCKLLVAARDGPCLPFSQILPPTRIGEWSSPTSPRICIRTDCTCALRSCLLPTFALCGSGGSSTRDSRRKLRTGACRSCSCTCTRHIATNRARASKRGTREARCAPSICSDGTGFATENRRRSGGTKLNFPRKDTSTECKEAFFHLE